jgi:hypothetical protein
MIKANELRFGNYIYAHGCTWNFDTTDYRYYDCDTEGFPDFEAIPLTSEILKAADFAEVQWSFFVHYTRVLVGYEFRLDYVSEGEYHWIEGNTNVPIYYVHQLQNLYFILTGTELELQVKQPRA